MNKSLFSRQIKEKANELGFFSCGISKADFLETEAPRLENWLNNNQHGTMSWMENHFDKRLDPRLLVDNAKSVISVLLNYYPEEELQSDFKIAKYAYGRDYHKVIKGKLKTLCEWMSQQVGDFDARIFVDSAPVMDKAWAQKSGLGWIGKNTNLITKQVGSFYLIGEIICDIPLDYDHPTTDHCGKCTACIDACPTDALITPYQINASKCISYLTIELKENIPTEFKIKMENWVFGCDICQDVCPWNRFSKPHSEKDFLPKDSLKNLTPIEYQELTEEIFNSIFEGTPIKRTKFAGFRRNVSFLG